MQLRVAGIIQQLQIEFLELAFEYISSYLDST